MSTWTCEPARWPVAALAAALLSGCLSTSREATPVTRTALYQGDVIIASPAGYCIDESQVRRRGESSFVLMAGCAHLSGEGPAVDPAVLTVSVLPGEPGVSRPSAEDLARTLSPRAEPLGTVEEEGLALVHLAAGGDRAMPGGDARYWRGSMVINDHLTGLAVYARRGSRLSGAEGRFLVMALAEALRDANPPGGLARPAAPGAASEGDDAEAEKDETGGFGKLLSGLFGDPS